AGTTGDRALEAGGPPDGDPPVASIEPAASGDGLERVLEVVLGDAPAKGDAGLVRPPVMQACPTPGVDDLRAEVVRPREVVDGVEVARGAIHVEPVEIELEAVRAEELREHLRHG